MKYAICGYARSGKSTVTDLLIKHGFAERQYALADPIKVCINALFGWNDRHKDGDLKESVLSVEATPDSLRAFYWHMGHLGLSQYIDRESLDRILPECLGLTPEDYIGEISPRQAYQRFGTDFGRKYLHEDIWLKIIPEGDIVISDCRFPNEETYFRDHGYTIIKIQRDDAIPVNLHESESYIPQIRGDINLFNNQTLADLEQDLLESLALYS